VLLVVSITEGCAADHRAVTVYKRLERQPRPTTYDAATLRGQWLVADV